MMLPSDPQSTVNLTVVLAIAVAGIGLAVRIVIGKVFVHRPIEVEAKSHIVK